MFLKIKKQNNEKKNKVCNYNFNFAVLSTYLVCKSVCWFLYNRQNRKVKS